MIKFNKSDVAVYQKYYIVSNSVGRNEPRLENYRFFQPSKIFLKYGNNIYVIIIWLSTFQECVCWGKGVQTRREESTTAYIAYCPRHLYFALPFKTHLCSFLPVLNPFYLDIYKTIIILVTSCQILALIDAR